MKLCWFQLQHHGELNIHHSWSLRKWRFSALPDRLITRMSSVHLLVAIFTNQIIPCSPWTCHGIWLWRPRQRLLTCRFADLRRFSRLKECGGFWRRSRTPPLLLAHRASAIVSGWGIELCVAMAMMAAWLMFPSERGKFPFCQTRETWSDCPAEQKSRKRWKHTSGSVFLLILCVHFICDCLYDGMSCRNHDIFTFNLDLFSAGSDSDSTFLVIMAGENMITWSFWSLEVFWYQHSSKIMISHYVFMRSDEDHRVTHTLVLWLQLGLDFYY